MSADKPIRPFLRATEAMINALETAEGMTTHELRCFRFNFGQFVEDMIEKAEAEDVARKYPMRRHDWGREERQP